MLKKLLPVAVLVLGFMGRAHAVAIAPVDLDVLLLAGIGPMIAGPTTTDFFTAPPGSVDTGDLTNSVFFDGTIYTYVHAADPSLAFISEFNTGQDILGFTGIAGWSFSSAAAAGGTGTAADFSIFEDPDGTIDWSTLFGGGLGWSAGDPAIVFFYQSTLPPGLGTYNVINGEVASAVSFTPVVVIPEPATLLLVGCGLAVAGLVRRRSKA